MTPLLNINGHLVKHLDSISQSHYQIKFVMILKKLNQDQLQWDLATGLLSLMELANKVLRLIIINLILIFNLIKKIEDIHLDRIDKILNSEIILTYSFNSLHAHIN
jgi:hypothetical protein